MARRRGRRRRRRRSAPSVSIVTYQRFVDIQVAAGTANQTAMESISIPDVANMSGESVNRKILRATGTLAGSVHIAGNQGAAAMFALLAHPDLEDIPPVSDFDPFDDGPDGSNTYKGRPSPRPFGRKYFAFANVTGASTATFQEEFRYRTRAQRLLRPGWKLSGLLYVRSNRGVTFRVNGIVSIAVSG